MGAARAHSTATLPFLRVGASIAVIALRCHEERVHASGARGARVGVGLGRVGASCTADALFTALGRPRLAVGGADSWSLKQM